MKVEIGPYPKKNSGKRKVSVRIHNYDVWNMDSTLALIILPMLKKLQKIKKGSPSIEDKDVPAELRSIAAPKKKNDWETDKFFHPRWEWVLTEMIWAFSQIDTDWESKFYSKINKKSPARILDKKTKKFVTNLKLDRRGLNKHHKRMQNGFRLFGKYYQALWD